MSTPFRLARTRLSENTTIGELYLPSGEFFCHTLEDAIRAKKVYGKTAIPSGTYEVGLLWSDRYQRQMPRLLNVPFFTGILIHPGNDATHTEGCILVGRHDERKPDFIGHSRDTFDLLYPILRRAMEKGKVFLAIEGGYAPEQWST